MKSFLGYNHHTMKVPQIIYSNSLEKLYLELKKKLFTNSHPFAKRIIAVPTSSVKSWLMQTMGKDPDLMVCAGVEILYLDSVLDAFVPHKDRNTREPKQTGIALAIETILRSLSSQFKHLNDEEKSIWNPIIPYCASEKKLQVLSLKLAEVFQDYGKIGPLIFDDISLNNRWQHELWNKLEETFSLWNYPYRKYTQTSCFSHPNSTQLHLFGVNHLTPLYCRYLHQINMQILTVHYVLSPCLQFWSDIVSDKERIRLGKKFANKGVELKQIEELEGYLTDTNPLLANLGKQGRIQAKLLEECEGIVEELYQAPAEILDNPRYSDFDSSEVMEPSENRFTLLKLLQTDLLLLKNPHRSEKYSFDQYDDSIQLHAVPKPSREIDVVYDVILEAMVKDHVLPEEIVVVSPNIQDYIPYIHSVFNASENRIPSHIISSESIIKNTTIQGYLQLLSLAHSKWEVSSVLSLFHNTSFKKRHHVKADDVSLLETIVEKTGIRWGKCDEHRRKVFGTGDHPELYYTIGTWKYGFGRALEGITMIDSEEYSKDQSSFCPLDGMNLSQADSLSLIMQIFDDLQMVITPIEKDKKTIDDWVIYFKRLYDNHFVDDGDAKQHLFGCLDELKEARQCIEKEIFPSSSIIFHLNQLINKKESHSSVTNVQSVRFCSLKQLGPIPAKLLIFIGMVDGAFPSLKRLPSFHLMNNKKWAEELVSSTDFERYQFLEYIVSVKDKLVITYPSQCGGKTSEFAPCAVVKDLFNYLDTSCTISGKKPSEVCIRKHHLLPFHYEYFSEKGTLKSYSQQLYNAAKTYYQQEKEVPPSFLSIAAKGIDVGNECSVIALSDLITFAKHPIRTFLRNSLGIYISNDQENDNEPIVCSSYQKSILLRQSFKNTIETTLEKARKMGSLPNSAFTEVDVDHLCKESAQSTRILKESGINIQDCYAIEFDEKHLTVSQKDNIWYVPSISINDKKIVGRIDHVHSLGIIFFQENELKKAIEVWPQVLVHSLLIDTYQLPLKKNIFFLKKGKLGCNSSESLDAKTLFHRFINHYLVSQHQAAFVMPEWISSLLKEDFTSIGKNIGEDNKYLFTDEYLKWLDRRCLDFDWGLHARPWKETAQHLFQDLAMEWYPSKKQAKEQDYV